MADTPIPLDDKILLAAADWWTRLRDTGDNTDKVSDDVTEQWLEWALLDPRHMEAFEHVTALGMRLGNLDALTRQRFINEFARPVPAPRRRFRWPLAVVAMTAAASVALMALAGYVAWTLRYESEQSNKVYVSAVAQKEEITLPDGTKVTLGGASRLTADFSHKERRVELSEGEAFFQIEPDARPFLVTAGALAIRDIGTAFDVRRTGQHVSVAVSQGRVQVSEKSSTHLGSRALEAGAGQRIFFDPAVAALRLGDIAPEQTAAWRDDRLEFINEPLDVVVANINRYSPRPLRIADSSLETLTFTGSIKTDAIDSWVNALPKVLPVQVKATQEQIVLSRAQGKASP